MVFAMTEFPPPMMRKKRRCSSARVGKRMLIGTCGTSTIFSCALHITSFANGTLRNVRCDLMLWPLTVCPGAARRPTPQSAAQPASLTPPHVQKSRKLVALQYEVYTVHGCG